MTRLEATQKAIHFGTPPHIPIVRYEKLERADMIKIPVERYYDAQDGTVSDWGFQWEKKNVALAMGQPKRPALPDWDLLPQYKPVPIEADTHRFDKARETMAAYPGRYYLADLALSGFTIMSFIRGFSDLLTDFYEEPELVEELADIVFSREEELIRLCAAEGFHGVCLADDMGTQQNLLFSRDIFRKFFKKRFRHQIDLAHSLGMDVYLHSCGNVFELIPAFIDCGLDIMNTGQPSLNGIERMAREFGNDLCFALPVGYQTTAVTGTLQDVENELLQYIDCFAKKDGGYIALVLRGYEDVFGAEKQQKIIEIYDKHCGKD